MSRSHFLSFCLVLLAVGHLWSEEPAPTIRRIMINRKNVFETGTDLEKRFPYSWGNKLHITTKESFIRNELLVREGDPYNPEKIRESERVLRAHPIFRYVKITPQPSADGQVDLIVETEDVWTTSVLVSYSVAGGKASYALGIHEQNFLGTGKAVGAFVRKRIDRTVRGVNYFDPQLLGSRWNLFGGYGKDEKGREWETALERPYYSSSVRHSEGVSVLDRTDEDRFFDNGDEVATFRHDTHEVRAFTSYAFTARPSRTGRATLAYEANTDHFSDSAGPEAPVLPDVRRVNPVLAGLAFENVRYHKIRGVTTFDRDEDINLGANFSVEAGPSNEHTGATQRGWVGRAMAGKNFHFWDTHVWLNSARVDGRLDDNVVQNGVFRLQSEYYVLDWLPRHTVSLRGEHLLSRHLDPERQFLLGGENGLRGYSVRQFAGPNRTIITLEDRRGVLYDWLKLVSMGWAVFVDAGAIWPEGPIPDLHQFRSDVGAGLRFAPSRSVDPGLIRIDVAYALQENERRSRFVINIGADLTFGDPRVRKFDQ